jgi:hypothetical protein
VETAVVGAGFFQLDADTSGREVICIGHRRLPKVVLPQRDPGLKALNAVLGVGGGRAFSVSEGDPWVIRQEPRDDTLVVTAAEEYLVMGLRPLLDDGRPVRLASGGTVVRAYVLPWSLEARHLAVGSAVHYLVTSTRGLVGRWRRDSDGRRGVLIGVAETWVSMLERRQRSGHLLVLRADVPVPWVEDGGVTNVVPTAVGVYEVTPGPGDDEDTIAIDAESRWVAKLPVVMTEGSVIDPVEVPGELELGDVPDGPWEFQAESAEGPPVLGFD